MRPKTNHILVFSPLYPPHVGGLESHAAQWNTEMASRGHAITVWTPRIPPHSPLKERTSSGVDIFRYPAFELIPNYPFPNVLHPTFWKQLRFINWQAWDLVVSRTRFFPSSLLALLYARIRRIPLLHIEHGSDFVHLDNPFLRRLAKIYDQALGRLVLRQANAVVANSRASAVFVRRLSAHTPEAVIYRGINSADIAAIPSVPPAETLTITYAGRLIDGKGVQDLLEALALLDDNLWQAWVIGSGPQHTSLQLQATSLGIRERVHFLGELSWHETIAHMKASSIIVNPSYTEGLPTSIIEAALAGAAIIATNVGGTGEIVRNEREALLVPAHNPDALTAAIRRLREDTILRRKLAEAAYRSIIGRFSWPTAMRAYEDLIFSLRAKDEIATYRRSPHDKVTHP